MDIALAYIRVSGKGQIDGDGPERQRDATRAFADAHQLPLSRTDFFEAGVSGTKELLERPAFTELLEEAEVWQARGENVVVLVERLDRLARDLMVQEFLLKECKERNIKVYACDQGILDLASDDIDPTRKLIRQVLGALAEWEKSALVLKLKKARDRSKSATGTCEGAKPFGSYSGEKDALTSILTFKSQGHSWNWIAKVLNAQGMKPRNSATWTRRAVQSVFKTAQANGLI